MEVKIPKKQRTLKNEAVVSGKGLFTDQKSVLRLLPAKEGTGIVFVGRQGVITADYFSLAKSFSTTSLKHCGFIISGVEHLLSALYGMFIDNVEIEVYGSELPSGDGSSYIFYEAIEQAGVEEQSADRKCLELLRPISVENNGSFISIVPGDRFSISYRMGNPYPKVVHGSFQFTLEEGSYSQICRARTWAEQKHVNNWHRKGAKGLDRSNCLIINNDKFSSELRYSDEAIRHKVLDCIGDLSLLFGMYIKGSVVAFNAGHKLHHELMKGIFNDPPIGSNRAVQRNIG